MNELWTAFLFFLPAGLANMFASLSGNVPKLRDLSYPMDFNLSFRGKRIFGTNKTIRGLVVGVLVAMFTAWILNQAIILGLLLGLGAILGDAVKSFFKRQIDVAPGNSWLFFDQIDYILGGILLSMVYIRLSFEEYIYIALIYFALHFTA